MVKNNSLSYYLKDSCKVTTAAEGEEAPHISGKLSTVPTSSAGLRLESCSAATLQKGEVTSQLDEENHLPPVNELVD